MIFIANQATKIAARWLAALF